MIKATAVAQDGVPILLLGLSAANLDRLRAGNGIPLEAAELGLPPLHLFLFGGETEEAMQAQLTGGGIQFGQLIDEKTPYDQLRDAVAALVDAVGTAPVPASLRPAYDRVVAAWTLGSDSPPSTDPAA